jgi:plastocyanin
MSCRRAVLAAAAALACAALAPPAAPGSAPPKPPTRVLVRAQEFDLLLSRLRVDPGSAVIQYYNDGEDSHDLVVQRAGDPDAVAIPELPPGELGEIGLELRRRSRYVMWCSLPNHRELGMEATLRVRRAPG